MKSNRSFRSKRIGSDHRCRSKHGIFDLAESDPLSEVFSLTGSQDSFF
jgi:hypothetical protein